MQRASHILLLCGVLLLAALPFFLATGGIGSSTGDMPRGLVPLGLPYFDFGEQKQGQTLSHVFTLLNNTSFPISITEYRTSCACVVAQVAERDLIIPAGETLEVPLSLTITNQNDDASGRVLVFYRKEDGGSRGDDDRKHLALQLHAKITPDYLLSTEVVDFGEIDGLLESNPSRIIRFTPLLDVDIEITGLTASSKSISARLLPAETTEPTRSIEVALLSSAFDARQEISERIILSTTSKRSPKSVISVRAIYNAPVEISPASVIIESSERGEVTRDIHINTAYAVRVLSASSSDPDAVSVSVNPNSVGNSVLCHVAIAPPTKSRVTNCQLHFIVELLPEGRERVIRKASIPVFRF
jgi:hypothetical protein